MSEKMKLKLDELKVQSFVTSLDNDKRINVRGGRTPNTNRACPTAGQLTRARCCGGDESVNTCDFACQPEETVSPCTLTQPCSVANTACTGNCC